VKRVSAVVTRKYVRYEQLLASLYVPDTLSEEDTKQYILELAQKAPNQLEVWTSYEGPGITFDDEGTIYTNVELVDK
jgi:hypothetical protein